MRYILFIVVLFFSTTCFPGVVKKAVFSGIGVLTIDRVITQAILDGTPGAINAAIKIAQQVKKTGAGQNYLYSMLSFYIVTDKTSDQARNSLAIITGAGIDTPSFSKKISRDMHHFDEHVITLESVAEQIEKENKYRCYNKNLIYKPNADVYIRSVHSPIQEWDYGSYFELDKLAVSHDKLEHDHIPSISAVLRYLEKRDGYPLKSFDRFKGDGAIVSNNATTLEIKESLHKLGRTYKGKNTQNQVLLDSADLRLATIKDLAYYYLNSDKLSQKMVTNFVNVFIRNRYLCLYERI